MMKKISRIIVITVSIVLISGYFFPIWEITLDAPQYPEGLGMTIWINTIKGDLQTINGLNHYIGMKTIEPDSIKELKIMPYLLALLIALGLIAGISGKKKLLALWVMVFVLLGTAGAVDFYMWEYDYGHNLNPEAAIKVPGMSYQPPLIGSKQLLNFTAYSYPGYGGIALIAGGIIGVLTLIYEWKYNKSQKKMKKRAILILSALLAVLISCSTDPEPINYGSDQCDHCRMTIMDSKFGAEIITKKGKVYKFDAAECLVRFIKEGKVNEGDIQIRLVTDASKPGQFVDALNASYLVSEKFPSPMGANLSAYGTKGDAEKFQKEFSGELMTWNDVLIKLKANR